jgi:acyl carrier protein phosphodiesterase
MKRFTFGALLVASISLSILYDAANAQKEKDKKAHTIKEIMKIAHSDKMALLKSINTELKGEKWEEVTKHSKELVGLAEEMAEAKPKKGEADSWKKVTAEYKENALKLGEAADKKKGEDAKSSLMALQTSCKGCHSLHK